MEKTPPPHRTHPTPHPPPTGGISRDPHEAKLAERTFLIAHSPDFISSVTHVNCVILFHWKSTGDIVKIQWTEFLFSLSRKKCVCARKCEIFARFKVKKPIYHPKRSFNENTRHSRTECMRIHFLCERIWRRAFSLSLTLTSGIIISPYQLPAAATRAKIITLAGWDLLFSALPFVCTYALLEQ